MNWNDITKNVVTLTKINNMHETLKGQAKGLRRLSRKNHSLRVQLADLNIQLTEVTMHRQRLNDMLDSRDHDIQILKIELVEAQDGSLMAIPGDDPMSVTSPLHDDVEAIDDA